MVEFNLGEYNKPMICKRFFILAPERKPHLARTICALIALTASLVCQAQTLEALVAEAIREHPRVLAARASALGVKSEIDIAASALEPRLSVSGGGGRNYSFAGGNASRTGDVILQGSYPLWDADRSVNEINRQEARFLNAQQKADQIRELLIAQTADAYIEIVKQEGLLKISKDNVQAHLGLMEKVEEIVKLDRGRGIDAIQVAVRLQMARVTMSTRQNGLSEARAALADLVGRTDTKILDPRDPSNSLPQSLEQAATWLTTHPSVKAAMADAKVADYAAKIASTWAYPKVELLGSLNNPTSAVNNRYFSGFDVRLGVQWPLFDGGAGKAAESVAIQQKTVAQESVKALLRELSTEVSRQWFQVQSREGRFAAYGDLAMRASAVREAYWEQFRIGRRSILDLLNAENEVFQAMLAAETERQERVQLQYRLLAATGRLAQWLGLAEPNVSTK
jgi:outer membrane protein, adhesin transport system